jgi:tetratricopeptide (TPR) repeat protein
MRNLMILILLALILIFSCSKKEKAVQTMEGLQPLELLEKGNQAYLEGNMEEALQAYGVVYNRYPTSREYIDAVLGMARAYNNMGDFERGFNLLYDLIRENMVPSRVPEIYNEMAKYYEVSALYGKQVGIAREEEDYQKALSYYQKAVDYPNSDDAKAKSYAHFQIGELYVKLGKFQDAGLAYQSTVYKYQGTEWAQLAQQRFDQLRQEGQITLSPIQPEQKPILPVTQPSDTTKTPK